MLRYHGCPPVHRIPVRMIGDERGPALRTTADVTDPPGPAAAPDAESDWKARALQLQVEMAGFRKRQDRRANDAATLDKGRLLRRLLPVLDNLDRALDQGNEDHQALLQGIALTHRELMHFLETEGVTPIEAEGQPFTPGLHEALATLADPVRAGTVVKVVEPGYMLNSEPFGRPARVVVAA